MRSYEELYQEAQKDPAYWTAKVTHSFAISLNNLMLEKKHHKNGPCQKNRGQQSLHHESPERGGQFHC